jgi:Tol biopolymer transport system component
MKSINVIFIFMALLLSAGMRAEERVVINDNIEATVQSGVIPISINCDDVKLGAMVRAALNAHGAFSVRNGSSVKLNIGRTALTAAVACDNARFNFQDTIEGRDEEDLAMKVADAAVVGLGRMWQLKPMFAKTKIAFVSTSSGHSEIYTTNLIYSRIRRITDFKNTSISPRWSADAGKIYFVSSMRTGFPEIFTTKGTGDLQKVITDVRGALGGANCGPDGRIAFASSNKGGSMDIYVAGGAGEGPRRVIATADVDADPSWSPDGSKIVLTSGPSGRPGIYVSSASGGSLTRLSTGYSYCTEPRWNPKDPAQIIFTFQSGRLGLAVADITKGEIVAVPTTSPLNLSHASWCADGRHVVATQATKTTSHLVIVDTKSGKTTRLTDAKMGNCSEPDCWVSKN